MFDKWILKYSDKDQRPQLFQKKRLKFWGVSAILFKVIVFVTIVVTPLQLLLANDYLATEAEQIYQLTNELRESQNLPPLQRDPKLEQSSEMKVDNIVSTKNFSHGGLQDYLASADYSYKLAGENLARGFYSAEEAIEAWKQSPTHYANLIDPNYRDIGISIEQGEYNGKPTIFIAQHFGAPNQPNIVSSFAAATLLSNKNESVSKYQVFKSLSKSNKLVQITYYTLISIFGLALLAHLVLEFKKHQLHLYKDTALFLLLIVSLTFV